MNYNAHGVIYESLTPKLYLRSSGSSRAKTNSKISIRSMTHVPQSMRTRLIRSTTSLACCSRAELMMRREICFADCSNRIPNIDWSRCSLCNASRSSTIIIWMMSVTWRWVRNNRRWNKRDLQLNVLLCGLIANAGHLKMRINHFHLCSRQISPRKLIEDEAQRGY